jgi:hypothetical protein
VPGRTRTSDLQVRNLTLYPLSYGHVRDGVWADGPGGPWNSFFTDPDGNHWAVQEKPGM